MVTRKSKGGALRTHKSYNFTEKEAIIDVLRTAIDDAAMSHTFVCNKSGVCKTTLRNWFSGKTNRPQYPTLNAVGRVVGLKLDWVRIK